MGEADESLRRITEASIIEEREKEAKFYATHGEPTDHELVDYRREIALGKVAIAEE